ncbi:acyl-CoA-binding domain-containing protein 6-like [Symsagittifera roscoffensis]|uniref:acyl-CoA-binding domain-containing protein 6-like n=1 Tax=Symsagittifera roscoffensis TaxID=84072 RepID=UPI00307C07A9
MDDVEYENELFNQAANFVQTQANTMKAEDLLYLYGRYKQSLEGDCHTQAPSFWDLTGKRKYSCWKSLAGMEKSRAQMEYVEKVSSLFPDWETEASKTGSQGFRLSNWAVSRPVKEDCVEDSSDDSKSIYDWCQIGNCEKVRELLTSKNIPSVDDPDPQSGMALIHWAADRGNYDMLKMLLDSFNADINVKDSDGQTALHYAVSCEHLEAVQLLLDFGADRTTKDNEGLLIVDLDIENKDIRELLRSS